MSKKSLSTSARFILSNFKGQPVSYYLIDEISTPTPVLTKEPKHHITIVDASGSMFYVIRDTRTMIEKVMTVEEFSDPDQYVSLVTYASKGDVIVHFARVPVSEILKPGSKYTEIIRCIEARGMTCASQAFDAAVGLVRPGETTAISLHTDGFFNDPSPTAEQRSIDAILERAKPMKNLFVNTIAYGSADFVAMSRISNALSGKCIKATTVKDVYTALHDTQALLAGRLTPAILVPKGDADYQLSVNVTQKKINGTTADLSIRGARPDDNLKIYRYRKVTEAAYNNGTGPEATLLQKYAFTRSKLAEGSLNEAKCGLVSTCNQTLLERHAKALTNAQLTALAVELEVAMFFDPSASGSTPYVFSPKPGLANADKISLLALFGFLNEHTDDFTVDLTVLASGYKRQGVKKISGIWSHEVAGEVEGHPNQEALVNTTFLPCPLRLVPTDDSTMVSTGGFLINNAEATINLRLERPVKLEKDKVEVKSVAGVKLAGKLTKFNNYTIIGSGDVNVDHLPLRIEKKALHAELVKRGVLPTEAFDPKKLYLVPLREFPVVPFDQAFGDLPADLVQRMAKRRALLSLCDVLLKIRKPVAPAGVGLIVGGVTSVMEEEEIVGVPWTAEQEKELADFCLSAKLNFSPPTRNPYLDRKEAVAKGIVDTRPKYKIDLGDCDLLALTDLTSANAFFGRRFLIGGEAKMKIEDLFRKDAGKVTVKDTTKMKLGPVDKLMFPLYEGFVLGKPDAKDPLALALKTLGVSEEAAKGFRLAAQLAEVQKAALEVSGILKKAQEQDYARYVRPLAFYIGSSGLVPDGWDVKILDATALVARFKNVGNGDADATYLVSGETIVTLTVESVDVLTPAGLELVKKLTATGAEEEE